ncbi:MAG: hypothetical protein FJ128_14305 [Deltaproteobacteria bacterium]|nr:hypothetical protein [Deltaproteobacteria bacterium]
MRRFSFPARGLAVTLVCLALSCTADMAVKTPLGDIVWDQYRQERRATREEASARYNYCPTDGCVIRLESVEVSPSPARRGERLRLNVTYTLLTADPAAIPLTLSQELLYEGGSLGKRQSTDLRNYNGTWSQKTDFQLPADAARGSYTLVSRISSAFGMDQKRTDFFVE